MVLPLILFSYNKPQVRGEIHRNSCAEVGKSVGKPTKPVEINTNKYVTIFAFQTPRNPKPEFSHVFAVWFAEKDRKISEGFVVSWYPKDGQEYLNHDLRDSYDLAMKTNKSMIYRYGPYFCTEDFYQKAKNMHDNLVNKDKTTIEKETRSSRQQNAIFAISDISGEYLDLRNSFGRDAAKKLTDHLISHNLIASKSSDTAWEMAKSFFKVPN